MRYRPCRKSRFCNLQYRLGKLVDKYLLHLWSQIEGQNFNSNKPLNEAGCTVKYGLINSPINSTHATFVTERCFRRINFRVQIIYTFFFFF